MSMRKKMIQVLPLILCMLLLLPATALANEDTRRIFDYAELLTEEEEAELADRILAVEPDVETELYILTTNDTEGKETVDYADDFGDEHAFGYDMPYGNYMILCIDMQNRIVWLSTSGKAEEYFTEQRIDALLDEVYVYLPDGDYYNTCMSYIETGEEYLSREPVRDEAATDPDRYQDTIYRYDEEEEEGTWLFRLLVSVVVGVIVAGIMSYHAGTKVTVDERTYSRNGVQIRNQTDAFLRRTTTSRRIETNQSGGGSIRGGGGHHTSSGGHSHGGGGRSF